VPQINLYSASCWLFTQLSGHHKLREFLNWHSVCFLWAINLAPSSFWHYVQT